MKTIIYLSSPKRRFGFCLSLFLLLNLLVSSSKVRADYADVNGIRMYFEVHGQGPPLVLLHGGFGSTQDWTPYLAELGKKFRLILIDQEAHGRTSNRGGPLRYEQMVEDTHALLMKLKLTQVSLYGYSDGGIVALAFALKYPTMVKQIAVLGINAQSLEIACDTATYQRIINLPDDFDFPGGSDRYRKTAYDPDHWPELVKKLRALYRSFEGWSGDELSQLKVPLLILHGDRDGIQAEHAVWIYRHTPNASLTILPNCDHIPSSEDHRKIIDHLFDFFENDHSH